MGGATEHIVMLPFMAQGHLIPFLALANNIHRRFGFTITIATTAVNAAYLRTATPNHHIRLFELDFDSSKHGLPPNAEITEALPPDQIITLLYASASLQPPFRALIRDLSASDGRPPLCVISDLFLGWADEVARSCGTVNVTFTTCGAYGTAAYVSLWQHLPHREKEDPYFTLPGFPDTCTFHLSHLHPLLRTANAADALSRFLRLQIAHSLNSFGWLCNSADEIEPLGFDVLRRYTNCPVWGIGPLLPQRMLSSSSSLTSLHAGREPGVSPEECLRWLDSHERRSVLYISFGSQSSISPRQMMALAMGLEDSEKAFVWVIRPPVGFDLRGEFKPEWLPPEFEKRVTGNNQGLVVHGWAPQVEILCHESTGAFLSHCGWNSVMESLSQGVPIIGWPLAAEQRYNAKMLVEELVVCVEMTRGLESEISRDEVKRVVETMTGTGDKAEEMKSNASRVREVMRAALNEEGSSSKAMEDFVSALLSYKQMGSDSSTQFQC